MNIKSVRFGRYLGLKHEDTLERAGKKAGCRQSRQVPERNRKALRSISKGFEKIQAGQAGRAGRQGMHGRQGTHGKQGRPGKQGRQGR